VASLAFAKAHDLPIEAHLERLVHALGEAVPCG
jgi:hypothetical protein